MILQISRFLVQGMHGHMLYDANRLKSLQFQRNLRHLPFHTVNGKQYHLFLLLIMHNNIIHIRNLLSQCAIVCRNLIHTLQHLTGTVICHVHKGIINRLNPYFSFLFGHNCGADIGQKRLTGNLDPVGIF